MWQYLTPRGNLSPRSAWQAKWDVDAVAGGGITAPVMILDGPAHHGKAPWSLVMCLPLPAEDLGCWSTAGGNGLTQPWQHPWGWGLSQLQFLLGPSLALVIPGMQVTAAVFLFSQIFIGVSLFLIVTCLLLPSSLWCLYEGEPCFFRAFSLHFLTHIAACFSACQALGVTRWCLPTTASHCMASQAVLCVVHALRAGKLL